MKNILEKFKEETAIASIVLQAERSDDITLTNSKFGGTPYLPKDYIYPTTKNGDPLKLLAQLNFSELPQLENFPTCGILQFFCLPDDVVGMQNWPNLSNWDTYKVIYLAEILPNNMQMKDFPEIKFISGKEPFFLDGEKHYAEGWFPFDGEYLLKGSIKNCPMNFGTYEFENAFKSFCKENNAESFFEIYYMNPTEVQRNMTKSEFKEFDRKSREVSDLIWDNLSGEEVHRISGYPSFTQYDPRVHGNQKKHDTLLFQMASQWNDEKNCYEISWGDAGVANFFISSEDLKKLNFGDVIYTWDCG